ncbi:DUF2238 domain-containing protein [Sandaracinus amylolyticus]|uniref:DUF2238 domain-containing protein n=1 Tax=Sandaracinus amylolyticus TaxID=927083 RepID=UPI001F385D87|nr:DUF2238 domain-containing protein [Sandaracinus amylolyticus]UJR86777.1 Hypothetical protein I5071_88780 [Sandaracinus amylolyticus]
MPRPVGLLLGWVVVCCVASLIGAADFWIWLFELALGLVAIGALALTWKRLRFTNVAYFMAGLHFFVLALGARYTYAEVPITEWLKDALDLGRNHFDRVGHFFQGLVPAVFAREVLIRASGMKRGALLFVIVSSICLAFSALYEILETLVVILFYPDSGPEWLGWQGDVWDAQWDMTCALVGSIVAQLVIGPLQDRELRS